jgi:hypothetical protein
MDITPVSQENNRSPQPRQITWGDVPWQIWVVVTVLSAEGLLSNLPAIPSNPAAATWFAAKCLFVVGLLNGWRPVFCLNIVIGVLHVLAFSSAAPFIAFLNLVLVLLVASSHRYYFPKHEASPVSH